MTGATVTYIYFTELLKKVARMTRIAKIVTVAIVVGLAVNMGVEGYCAIAEWENG